MGPPRDRGPGGETLELGEAIRGEWLLEEGVAFLNHGSFGATPRRVLEAQAAWRERLERQPLRFFEEDYVPALRAAAADLGLLIGSPGEDIAFVDNATTGVNAVARSLRFEPDDEILTTTHAYGAVRNCLDFVAARQEARLVEARVPFPLSGPDDILEAVERRISDRTRLAVVDHVTSTTGIVLPLERLLALFRDRGIPVLVDGAHAPGMVPMDLAILGAAYYTGNAHKWLCAPKGCAFLRVLPEHQDDLHPLVISHGYRAGFLEEFDWTGTRDPGTWLAITAALAFHRELGPERVREHNRALANRAGDLLAGAWGVERPVPASMIGSLVTLPLPLPIEPTEDACRVLNRRLRHDHGIEVPVLSFDGRVWVRISAQVYNHLGEYERLARAVLDLA